VKVEGAALLITGGASGLGREFVRHTARLGARVWALDRDEDGLEQTRREFAAAKDVHVIACDVGDERQVADAVAAADDEAGGLDVLVNNAAVLRDQALASRLGKIVKRHSLEDWHETLRSNLTGVFLMAREVAERWIRARRHGLIVNISSISRQGNPGQTAYAATKGAVDALTVTWSQELAVYGIRVAAIAPGFVETAMTARIPPMFLEQIRERTPIKRFGTLAEFGHVLQFVIENDYLNGKVVELDGGLRF
jgi:3-oxoacyl-[acyl-carrier protein] reductase